MKLRKKSFLFVAFLLLGVTAAILAVLGFVALRGIDRMENDDAIRTVQRVQKLLYAEMDALGRSARDYGTWGQLRTATESGDRDFVEEHLNYAVGSNLRWNLYLVMQSDGRVIASRELDAGTGRLWPASAAADDELKRVVWHFGNNLQPDGVQRLALVDDRLCLLALVPILSARDPKSQAGTLIIARYLQQSEIERLGRMADVSIQLLSASASGSHQAGSAQIAEAGRVGDVFVRREHAREVVGCAVLEDWSGRPIGVLEARIETLIREDGLRFTLFLMVVVILGELLILVLVDRLLLRDLIARLEQLGAGLGTIQHGGDFTVRLPVTGSDEITTLEREINQLLTSVDLSQRTLERVNAEMQQRVAERTAALADANAALEADISERIKAEQEREGLREQLLRAHKMEAVGTLAGGIAHDFNNILAGILGHTQLIASDLPPDHPTHRHLGQVLAAGERAAALVRQILAFSRQTPGERSTVSVGQIAREAMSLLRAALPAGIAIRCEMQTVADLVNADPTQLHQVFMNLGANAGHAMGSRGGELIIRIGRLNLGAPREGGTNPMCAGEYVSIEVTDTGCGMSSEVMDRIFDPFFSTKPVNEGTGLGLAVVHGIVTDHNGTIRVESEPGQGTTFRILLPAAENAMADSATRRPMPLTGTERLLVVDDEELVLDVMTKSLERLGYRVVAEQTSPGAFERFARAPMDFDLVITDQTMPRMSGLELCAAIRAIRPDIPVVLVTGYSPEVSGKDARSLGVAGIVAKPIDMGELTAFMRLALNANHKDPGPVAGL